jgi:glucose-1-phosphate cytidylyltransferase
MGESMKLVILAGGYGSRLSEETVLKPKPMVEIGGMPIIWHIMKIYSEFGINEFIICLGYKGYLIKEYFANYFLHQSDVTINLKENLVTTHQHKSEPWKITLIDTGIESQTGERLRRIRQHLTGEETFCLTYGDGLSDVSIDELINFHETHDGVVTLTSVGAPARYGALHVAQNRVMSFQEKIDSKGTLINGGFMVCDFSILDAIEDSNSSFEIDVLPKLASQDKLYALEHNGFWQAMDTLRERNLLENLWESGAAPWKIWS